MNWGDTKATLWANIKTLMDARYGREALGRFASETGIAPASMTRIKAQNTSVGIEILEQIARTFGLEPWQVIAPDLGAALYRVEEDLRITPAYVPHKKAGTPLDFAQAPFQDVTHTPPPSHATRSDDWSRTKAGKARERRERAAKKQVQPASKRRSK